MLFDTPARKICSADLNPILPTGFTDPHLRFGPTSTGSLVSNKRGPAGPQGAYQSYQIRPRRFGGSSGQEPCEKQAKVGAQTGRDLLRWLPRAIVTVLSVGLLGACASPPVQQSDRPADPPRILLVGVDHVPADIGKGPLWIAYPDSPALSARIRGALSDRGFALVNDEGAARYRIRVTGTFRSEGKVVVAEMPLGPIFEDASKAWTNRNLSTASTAQATTQGGIAVAGAEYTRMGYQNLFGGEVITALSKAIGVSGWFNEALVGDRRGICLSDCTYFHHSRQRARFDMYLTGPDGIEHRFGRAAEVYQQAFIPAELISVALNATLDVLGGPTPAAFSSD